jgi:hypothetical protein
MSEGKQAYIREVNISGDTYRKLALMQGRVVKIRNTFMRTLEGRKHISKIQKDSEERILSNYVSQNLILPFLADPFVWVNREQYLIWHRDSIKAIIHYCPIAWDYGERFTVGMSQKIVNLLTKDFWALDIIPPGHENFLHVVIDKVVLDKLGIKLSWTKLDDYSDYEELQLRFIEYGNRENRINGTQYSPIELENRIWLEGARGGGRD